MSGLKIVNGSSPTNGAMISRILAEELEVSVGDNISLLWTQLVWNESRQEYDKILMNISLVVEGIFDADGFALEALDRMSGQYYPRPSLGFGIVYSPSYLDFRLVGGCIIVSHQTYNAIAKSLAGKDQEYYKYLISRARVLVEFNKDELVIPWDMDETARKLDIIENKLYLKLSKYGIIEQDSRWLKDTINSLQIYASILRTIAMYTMLPLLILAIVLTVMVNWVTADIIARDIALLRIRGATKSSIGGVFALTGGLSGLIGGLVGSLISPFIVNFIAVSNFPNEVSFLDPLKFGLSFLPNYLLFSAIGGFILGLLVSLWVGNRAASLDITSFSSDEVLSPSREFKFGKLDIVLLSIGLYGIFELLTGLIVIRTLISLVSVNFLLFFALFIIVIIESIALSVGPFLFLYAVSKIIAGRTEKISQLLGLLVKPIMRDLSHIPVKGLSRNPARLSRVFFILSLALTISILIPIMNTTQINRERINSEIYFGADMRVHLSNDVNDYNLTIDLVNNISHFDGVRYVSPYFYTYMYAGSTSLYELIVINSTYLLFDKWRDEYLIGGSREDLAKKLSEPNTTIVNYGFAKNYGVKINDTVYIVYYSDIEKREVTYPLRVVGIAKFLVGYESFDIFIAQDEWMKVGIISLETFSCLKGISYSDIKIMIDTEENYDLESLKTNVSNLLDKDVGEYKYIISTFDDFLKQRSETDPLYLTIYLSEAEKYIVAVISFIAISLLMFVSIWERRRETSLLYVRGLSEKEIMLSLISEAFLISLIGLALGLIVAFSYASAFTSANLFTPESYVYPTGYLLSIPWYLPLYVASLILVFSLSGIPSYLFIVKRRGVLEEIRITH